MKRLRFAGVFSLLLGVCLLQGQDPEHSKYMDQARIKHSPQGATLTANDARPLDQAIEAMREEYGWLLDYEDPIYTDESLTELSDEDWRAPWPRTPGLLKPTGGLFTTTYPESPNMDSEEVQSRILRQVVADYRKSGNPGTFKLIQTAPGRFDVVGTNGSSSPVLDTVVAVNVKGKDANSALIEVLEQVETKTGHSVGEGFVPTNALNRCVANPEIEQGPARTVILSIFASCHHEFTWRFLYNANIDAYLLNIMGRLEPIAGKGKQADTRNCPGPGLPPR
jgi:hypothetical protein